MRLIPMYHIGEIARMLDPNRRDDDDYLNDVYSVIFYPNIESDDPVFINFITLIAKKDIILKTINKIKREETGTSKTMSLEKQLSYLGIIQPLIDAVLSGHIPEEFVIHRYNK